MSSQCEGQDIKDRGTGTPGRSQARMRESRRTLCRTTSLVGLRSPRRRNRCRHTDERDDQGPMIFRCGARRLHPRSAPGGS
eukprot:1412078-Pleurochrysis_carterae.AAC.1